MMDDLISRQAQPVDKDINVPCTDTISRQAAIEAVLWGITYAKAINKDTGEVMELFKQGNEELTKAADRLRNLPSAQPDMSGYSERLWKAAYERGKRDAQQEWVPVTERLPENNGRYLVTRGLNAAGNTWNRVYIVNYSDLMGLKKEKIFWIGNVGKNDFERIQDVTAWQPLPEPYKGEK